MSHQLGRLVAQILQRYCGEIVEKVGNDLFMYGSKPIAMIVKSTGLPRTQVIESLRTLMKFDLAIFEATGPHVDYKLLPDNVLLLIRYPRYLLQMKSKYGTEAELIIEELLQQATCSATLLLVTIANKYKDDKDKNLTIVTLKDTFISLATAAYIQQAPVAEIKEGSEIPNLVQVATIVPDLDTRALMQAMANPADIKDNIYWKVNYDRFHQDFRDDIMIKAMTRRIDDTAGEVMRLLLQQMYLSSAAWAEESNAIPVTDLRESSRLTDKILLHHHLEHYLKVMEENGAGFIRRAGDAGGGQYCVQAKVAAKVLVEDVLDHVVTERLGSKAARIFRLIRAKKYVEEEDIQKNAMLPNKECKQLTYKLLEEHFISVQPMRKSQQVSGTQKGIYLYHVKLFEAVHVCREMCYSSLHNLSRARSQLVSEHGRALDKQRRVRTIVHGMRMRSETEESINDVLETLTPPEVNLLAQVEKQLKQLSTAELELDRNLFILNWYLHYP
ncbi:DNA-directed RNA polymerase III subunit RPC3 isoform X1 [Pieris napi]|uniref:DNA-directed RNA polymerase III subunit RPC3 isoform X1 n=2 Tax=Pieris napi TaxID=78633 RepID=UPI001FBAC39A|nr:DNA-directed RNA polymerase III subunit RPC3 isoform X1 [Pieris napi]